MDIHIKVKPHSRQNAIVVEDGVLIVRVKAPPVDGKANKELVAYLSDVFGVPKSKMEISAGAGSKFKRISIPEEYEAMVQQVIAGVK